MSLTHDTFTFKGTSHLKHKLVEPEGPWDMAIDVGKFQGIKGEAHLIDERGGRFLMCPVILFGYETQIELRNAIGDIALQAGKLRGTLTMDLGSGDETDFDDCTFLGFQQTREPFKDGKANSTDKWCALGVLRWRQRKGN